MTPATAITAIDELMKARDLRKVEGVKGREGLPDNSTSARA